MGAAAGPADADRRRMLAQNEGCAPLLSQVVDDPPLKLLDLREVDQPQHIDFQRRQLRGWPHRLSGHRQSQARKTVLALSSVRHCISLQSTRRMDDAARACGAFPTRGFEGSTNARLERKAPTAVYGENQRAQLIRAVRSLERGGPDLILLPADRLIADHLRVHQHFTAAHGRPSPRRRLPARSRRRPTSVAVFHSRDFGS